MNRPTTKITPSDFRSGRQGSCLSLSMRLDRGTRLISESSSLRGIYIGTSPAEHKCIRVDVN